MVRVALLIVFPLMLLAAHVEELKWKEGETFLTFLEAYDIPQSLYYDLDKEDQKLTEEIISGVDCQLLKDQNGTLEQALIPVNDELQLHIARQEDQFRFDVLPIVSDERRHALTLRIENSPYIDIEKATGSTRVAQSFVNGFKNSLDFRRDLRKGDRLAMVYTRRYRLGKPFTMPRLEVAMIEMRQKRHYLYRNRDERYYNETGKEIEGFFLARPVRNARVSSGFTSRRYHPILKRYRAHLGIDYAARPGTPIMAATSGKVIFAGYTRGYGNLTKIAHRDGYVTLYAHQRSFRRGIHRGTYVKKGQVIGYVGTTGLSTGPHLHFGLYKNGRAINPARVVQVSTKKLSGQRLAEFKELKAIRDDEIEHYLEIEEPAKPIELFENSCLVDPETCREIVSNEGQTDETL